MKKRSLAVLLLCALLCSCQAQTGNRPPVDAPPSVQNPVNTDAAARIEYYEQLVNELQKEILALRAEIYVGRVEYEALMEDLLAATPSVPPDDGTTSATPQFFYTVQNGKATVTAYVGKETRVSVPSMLDGYEVVGVGDRAFMGCTSLASVELPTGVRTVGWFAFSGCVALKSVVLPDTVEEIAYGAFENCPSSLTLCCSPASYAAAYAQSYGLTVSETAT